MGSRRHRLPRQLAAFGPAILLLVATAGCIPPFGTGPAPVMAVATDGTRTGVIFLCPERKIFGVTVQRIDDNPGGVVEGPVLWRIASSAGTEAHEVVVGEVPSGFDVLTPLEEPLPVDEELLFVLDSADGLSVDASTRLSDLDSDEVAVYHGTIPASDFVAQGFGC